MTLNSDRLVPTNLDDPFYLEHIKRYEFAKKFTKGKLVLDLGCGVGYGSYYLAENGVKQVTGIDLDPRAIAYAKKEYKIANVKFQISKAEKLPFNSNTFDVVVSFEVIEHVADYKKFIKEALRVLKKEGVFIFSTPNKENYRGNTSAYHLKEFSERELRELLKSFGLNFSLYGQFFRNKKFVNEEKKYFERYNKITGSSPFVKKILNLVPSIIKANIYKIIWNSKKSMSSKDIIIKKGNLGSSITFIAVIKT